MPWSYAGGAVQLVATDVARHAAGDSLEGDLAIRARGVGGRPDARLGDDVVVPGEEARRVDLLECHLVVGQVDGDRPRARRRVDGAGQARVGDAEHRARGNGRGVSRGGDEVPSAPRHPVAHHAVRAPDGHEDASVRHGVLPSGFDAHRHVDPLAVEDREVRRLAGPVRAVHLHAATLRRHEQLACGEDGEALGSWQSERFATVVGSAGPRSREEAHDRGARVAQDAGWLPGQDQHVPGPYFAPAPERARARDDLHVGEQRDAVHLVVDHPSGAVAAGQAARRGRAGRAGQVAGQVEEDVGAALVSLFTE